MRYEQSVQHSAEILRMVLPQLPRHPAAYHPITYALWYEYTAGINPPLKSRIDSLVAEGRSIDNTLAVELYRELILDAWSSRALDVNDQLDGLVSKFEDSAGRACADAETFNRHWDEFAGELEVVSPVIREQIGSKLVESGQRVNATVGDLRQELESSVEEARRLREELRRLHSEVLTDPLTGLANRRGLDTTFTDIHRRALETGGTCSAILIDVDHFKRLNDNFGHAFGDQVLKSVAAQLRRRARAGDLVARLGGEEFLIVLPDADLAAAQAVAEEMRKAIERSELRQRGSSEVIARITISAGVATLRPGDEPQDMIARADAAMYRAKNSGRNQVALAA